MYNDRANEQIQAKDQDKIFILHSYGKKLTTKLHKALVNINQKIKPIKKGQGSAKQKLPQIRYTDAQSMCEKMPCITNHQGKTNKISQQRDIISHQRYKHHRGKIIVLSWVQGKRNPHPYCHGQFNCFNLLGKQNVFFSKTES